MSEQQGNAGPDYPTEQPAETEEALSQDDDAQQESAPAEPAPEDAQAPAGEGEAQTGRRPDFVEESDTDSQGDD